MAFTTVEIFALIIAIVSAIKILVIIWNPGKWIDGVKKLYVNPVVTSVVSLILAGVVLYYLLAEVTIVQIFAVLLFVALLAGSSLAVYSNEFFGLASKMMKGDVLKRAWLPILIWVGLIVWVLKVLLF
ncbi:MAG: hypothetical protein KKF56_04240 [Nanoarchaeota archaeon]|nr:hypothetical protein [Nanoarchaeota archaeon]